MVLQVFRQFQGVFAVPFHAQVQCFQSHMTQERIEGHHGEAQVTHPLDAQFDAERTRRKVTGIDQTVVALVRFREFGELAVRPVERTFFDHDPAHGKGVTIRVLRSGMGHDIRAEIEGLAEERCRERVVHNERHAQFFGSPAEFFKVQNGQRRVGNGLGKDRAGFRTGGGNDLFRRGITGNEGHFHAHFLEGVGEQGNGTAVERRACDHMLTAGTAVHDRHGVGGLTGGKRHRSHAAFEGSHLLFKAIDCGVGEAGIEKSRRLQVEQICHFLTGVVFIGGALNNGHHAGFAVLGFIACLNGKRFDLPILIHNSNS